MQQSEPVGILLISTNQYKQFVPQFIESLEKYFMLSRKLRVYLFTDEEINFANYQRTQIKQIIISPYKFPWASMYRYKIFTSRHYSVSHLFYFDVDMKVVAPVGEEILGNIVAVRHPGFDKVGGGSWETSPYSRCQTKNRKAYYAGGIQGGQTAQYYKAMEQMRNMIDEDEANGIIPVWHDESAWNCYLSKLDHFKELDSSYCMVEQAELRKKWKIDHIAPKIISLEKNHEKIRS